VLFYRRAFGIFWLLLLRNRPGSGVTLRRQAVHLLELLATAL
jgi:hypothetical protein